MVVAVREEAGMLIATWRHDGCGLGFTAIGTVCNLAPRRCAEAKGGQILVSSRVARAVEAIAKLEDLGNLERAGLLPPEDGRRRTGDALADAERPAETGSDG